MENSDVEISYEDKIRIFTTYCANSKNPYYTAKEYGFTHMAITDLWHTLSSVEKSKCEELALKALSDADIIESTKSFLQKMIKVRDQIVDVITERLDSQIDATLPNLTKALKEINDVIKGENIQQSEGSIFDEIEDSIRDGK